jgi:hypothetical protein
MSDLPNVLCLCPTSGRNHYVCRALTYFLYQKYDGEHTLFIYNNSDVRQKLVLDGYEEYMTPNKHVILVNHSTSFETGEPYHHLCEIYTDMLMLQCGFDCVNMYDDDDIYLRNHISEGARGYLRAKMLSSNYKMYTSKYTYEVFNDTFMGRLVPYLKPNWIEPSIFVDFEYLKSIGFGRDTNLVHHKWIFYGGFEESPVYADDRGIPTMICDVSVHSNKHLSHLDQIENEDADAIANDEQRTFEYFRQYHQDHGDGTIHPLSRDEMRQYNDFEYYF